MDATRMDNSRRFMHNTFWLERQISFTFEPDRDTFAKGNIQSLNLDDLVIFLNASGYDLPFNDVNTHRPDQVDTSTSRLQNMSDAVDGTLPVIYSFPPTILPDGTIPDTVSVVGFFQLSARSHAGMSGSAVGSKTIADDMNTSSVPNSKPQEEPKAISTLGPIPSLVNLINRDALLGLRAGGQKVIVDGVEKVLKPIPITSAAPNWLCGATGTDRPISQGCPLTPAIPVPADTSCSVSSGLWPITLPDLPADLKATTGDSVTVLVLDTLPQRDDIVRAAETVGEQNVMLLELLTHAKFSYPLLDGQLDLPNPSQVATGKDIHGKVIGFRMPDHGLFVAGIIHDIAPNAKIECIRILNDFCTGSVQQIIDTLNKTIMPRLSSGGDLHGKPVVINLSLVIPQDDDAINVGGIASKAVMQMARIGLLTAIQSLISLGAIFVASAGNEGDQRYNPMNMPTTRPEALYPAAFTYDGLTPLSAHRMIPVGAVDKDGHVTEYSCYPGVNGVATYGGNLPAKEDIYQDDEGMTRLKKIDGVIGVYTQLSYPALAYEDPEPTYPAPNAHGWAYWVGTSFATPIVSAVAAKALELEARTPASTSIAKPPTIVSGAATEKIMWDNLTPATTPVAIRAHGGFTVLSLEGSMIKAVQCKPSNYQTPSVGEGEQEVEINVTEVNITEVTEMPVLVVKDAQHGV